MKITYIQAKKALNTIVQTLPNGQTKKSELAKAKGDVGLKAYHLKHDLLDAIKAEIDKEQEIWDRFVEIEEKLKEKKDKALEKEKENINDEHRDLNQVEVEIKLTKGKFKIDEVKQYLDMVELEALEFAIDF